MRSLYPQEDLVDFSSNDYLGFAGREEQPGPPLPAGSSGSRLISGNHELYSRAEAVVRDFHRAETALIFNSGYDANLGLLSALLGSDVRETYQDGVVFAQVAVDQHAPGDVHRVGGGGPQDHVGVLALEDLRHLHLHVREEGAEVVASAGAEQ